MTSKIYPKHPRFKVNVVSSSYDDVIPNDNTIRQTGNNLIPSSSKSKISLWPTVFWIGLGILIFIALVIVVVVPVAALANTGTTTISTICPTTSITTTVTSSSLPAECSSYTTITDPTRSPDYNATDTCDTDVFSTTSEWVRFTGSGGTLLASCPIDSYGCGTLAPGWYSGVYPSLAGATLSGYVCYTLFNDSCVVSNLILVTNCNGFYVYFLSEPPYCNSRYCTI